MNYDRPVAANGNPSERQDLVPSGRGNGILDYRSEGYYPNFPALDVDPQAPQGFDYYKYLRIISKYRWLILGVTASSTLVCLALTYMMTPIYRATASIQIDRQTVEVMDVKNLQPEDSANSQEFYQTQYELLNSRSLGERVATSLGLANDAGFNGRATGLLTNVKQLFFGQPAAGATQTNATNKTMGILRDGLTVTPVRGSRIVKISFDHTDPGVAQKLANGYAETFITDNLDRRFDATSYARKFLEGHLEQLKVKLEDSEKQLVKYAQDQGIINLDNNKNLSTSDVEDINSKLATAREERIKRELLWQRAQETGDTGLKEILDSPAIQESTKQRAILTAQYQQKLAIFKPAFPDMVQLQNQIRETDRQIQAEVAAIKSSIQASYLSAKQEEDQLTQQLVQSKSNVIDQQSRSIQYNILKREVDTNRTLYDGLLQRYKEIGVSGGTGTNNISIVDRATRPFIPRSPNMLLNLAVGLLGGLLLGLAAAFFRDFLDDTFKAPEDVERELGLTVIGVIPKPPAGVNIEDELRNARSGAVEAIRSLRTGLQFSTSNGLPQSLLFTSAKNSEGKTTTSIGTATSLAQIGLNVLLIDADLRSPKVHRRLSLSNEVGLSNYLTGAGKPEDLVQATPTPGLVVLTSGPMPINPAELLAGPKFQTLLALATQSFNVVIVDGPPVMGLADAPLLASVTHSTILVIAANETRKSFVRVALRRLQLAKASIIGALLSKFDTREVGYGYGYGYGEYQYGDATEYLPLPNDKTR